MLKATEYMKTSSTGVKGLSKSWKVQRKHEGIYTGGKVQVSSNGKFMACLYNEDVAILNSTTGELEKAIQQDLQAEEKEVIVSFVIRPNNKHIVTASRNLLIRLWDLDTLECLKTIKSHETPVLSMDFDPTGTLVATGGSDRAVKVFDIEKGFCTHNFRGHQGIVTLVQFHPDPKKMVLISCGEDTTVRVWDLYAQKGVGKFTDHMSPVTAVDFTSDGLTMMSVGRDKVINFWDMIHYKLLKTVPIYESIEGMRVLPNCFEDGLNLTKKSDETRCLFVTGGEKGTLRVWEYVENKSSNTKVCNCVYTQEQGTKSLQYMDIVLNQASNEIVAVSSEHNFLIFDKNMTRQKQIIGYNDDIIALKYVPNPNPEERKTLFSKHIVVATNSEQIRIMNRSTLSCELLDGHSEIVMSVDVSSDGRWLVSVSKDRTSRLWDLVHRKCVAVCVGHTEAVGAVAISQREHGYVIGEGYFVTGGADKTLKKWSLKGLKDAYGKESEQIQLQPQSIASVKAHEKDINGLAISPNDRLIASASQDKTIKIWNSTDLSLAGTCKGHRRGVWSIAFSPVDQCLVSSSGDKTLKLWSVKDFSCLKTFEGHTASVLCAQFVTSGMQLLSSSADGLVKLWTIKTNECENTFDAHEDKIWTLQVGADGTEMITGGADSTINFWKDITEEEQLHEIEIREQHILKEQDLMNCLNQKKFHNAAMLAFELGHPKRLLTIFTTILEGAISEDQVVQAPREATPIDGIVKELNDEQLTQLLRWIQDWNTTTRNSTVAQRLITCILQNISPQRLQGLEKCSEILDALIAYTERHFNRLDRLMQKSYLVDYSIVSMRRLLPTPEENSKRKSSIDNHGQSVKRIKA